MANDFRLSKLSISWPPSQMVRFLQIIQGAMVLGVVLFGAVAIGCTYGLHGPSDAARTPDPQFANVLTIINVVLACGAIVLFSVVELLLLWRFKRSAALDPRAEVHDDSPALREFVATVLLARIIQLCILEASALFGEVACLVAGLEGLIHIQAAYLLNMVPAGLMMAYAIVTFPSLRRMRDKLRAHVARA